MARNNLIISLLVLFYGCAENTFTEPPPSFTESPPSTLQFGTDETLDILTWNIENFPKSNSLTVDYLSQLIIELDTDIVALQEIESQFYFDELINKLDGWEGYKANSAAHGLDLAFLYKSGLALLEPYEIYENDSYSFPRSPLILELEWNEKKIIIINNHLKAFSGSENEDRRKEACEKLESYISINLDEKKIIVLGDLNDELTDANNSNVFLTFINDSHNYQFIDINIATGNPFYWSYPSWPSHLDHILITNELFDNVVHTQTIIVEDYFSGGWSEYDDVISDHRPVGVRLMVGE